MVSDDWTLQRRETARGHHQHRARPQLRALRPSDLDFFRELAQDERVIRYVGDGRPWSDTYVQLRFDDALDNGEAPDREVFWFIAETPARLRVGLLALTMRPRETEVGYWISPAHWGYGYGTRLLEKALAAARDSRPEAPLVATVHRDNAVSRHILERAEFIAASPGATAVSRQLTYRRAPLRAGEDWQDAGGE